MPSTEDFRNTNSRRQLSIHSESNFLSSLSFKTFGSVEEHVETFEIPLYSEFYLPVFSADNCFLQVRPSSDMGIVEWVTSNTTRSRTNGSVHQYLFSEGVSISQSLENQLWKKKQAMIPILPIQTKSAKLHSAKFIHNCYLHLTIEQSQSNSNTILTFRPPLKIQNLFYSPLSLKIGRLKDADVFQPTCFELVVIFVYFCII